MAASELVIRAGDRVRGSGVVFADGAGSRLDTSRVSDLMVRPGPPLRNLDLSVAVDGAPASEEFVTVTGTWDGSVLHVATVSPFHPPAVDHRPGSEVRAVAVTPAVARRTRAELRAVTEHLVSHMRAWKLELVVDDDERGRPRVRVELMWVTRELADYAETLPPGLLDLAPYLVPLRAVSPAEPSSDEVP